MPAIYIYYRCLIKIHQPISTQLQECGASCVLKSRRELQNSLFRVGFLAILLRYKLFDITTVVAILETVGNLFLKIVSRAKACIFNQFQPLLN